MMKRTFFTVLLCIVLSFSIFTVDIYASSSLVPLVCNAYHYSIMPTMVSPTSFYYVSDEDGTSAGPFSRTDWINVNYTFVAHLIYVFNPVSDPSATIPFGTYSFLFYDDLPFEIKASTSGDVIKYASLSFQSASFRVLDSSDYNFFILNSSFPIASDTNTFTISAFFGGSSPIFVNRSVSIPIEITISARCHVYDAVKQLTIDSLPSIFLKLPLNDTGSIVVNIAPVSASDSLVGAVGGVNDSINDVNDTIKQEHQEEIDKADQVTSDATSGVGTLTNTLSTWEIITMPFNLVKNFAQAIAGDGSSALTFPSFSMMGYQIWPSYTFDLQTVASNFPLLYNGLHLVSGTVVVTGFVRYLWRKWSLLVGDDMPEGGDSS